MSEQEAVRMGCWDEVKAGTGVNRRQSEWGVGMRSRLETGVNRRQSVWLVGMMSSRLETRVSRKGSVCVACWNEVMF